MEGSCKFNNLHLRRVYVILRHLEFIYVLIRTNLNPIEQYCRSELEALNPAIAEALSPALDGTRNNAPLPQPPTALDRMPLPLPPKKLGWMLLH